MGDLTSNIYSSHSASQPPLYNTKYEMVQMLYLTGIYFDIFCNFLVNGAALAVSKQHQYAGWNLWLTVVEGDQELNQYFVENYFYTEYGHKDVERAYT